jgi:hypothetical protein
LAAAATCYITYKYLAGDKNKAEPMVAARKKNLPSNRINGGVRTLD